MSKRKSEYGGGYSQKDAQRDTNATRKQTQKAFHDARDKAEKSKGWNVPKGRNKK
ncbi:MAG: hypothetical protein ABIC36_01750 [bacterium]